MWPLAIILGLAHLAGCFVRQRTPRQSVLSSSREETLFFKGDYDGEVIEKFYSRPEQVPVVVSRLVEVGSPLLGWWLLKKWDKATSFMVSDDRAKRVRAAALAEDLKDAIVAGGSIAFIKSGQALSLRPDLVKSADVVRELQKLQDEVGTFSNEVAFEIMRRELGRDPLEVYSFDPPSPIASASIGQVYRAVLRATNETVAVKVQRPDALQKAPIDMFILRRLAAYLRQQKRLRSNLVAIADEFGSQLWQELNYTQEAANCAKFKDLYGEIPGIFCPSVFPELTGRRLLTMQFVEGTKGPWLRGGEKMLTIGLQCSVLQLLGRGFFHSDPHRGNLLQTPSGELAYLDFGMMCEVPASRRYALIGTVLGLVNKDLPLVVDCLKKLELLPPQTDAAGVVVALEAAVRNATFGGSGEGSSLNFTQLNRNIATASREGVLPFSLPPFYTLIVRTLTVLEGLALSVDPSFRLIKGAYPFIAKQILQNPEPEMQSLLRTIMVSPEGRIRWDRVEQFVSIAANADAAAAGDFSRLQTAQDRSDPRLAWRQGDPENKNNNNKNKNKNESDSDKLNLDVVTAVLDFLLSSKGAFLREPLVEEFVDTLDAIGLSAASLASYLSNGWLPRPDSRPDRARVEQALNLLLLAAGGSGSGSGSGLADTQAEGQSQSKSNTPSLASSLRLLLSSELLSSPAAISARLSKLRPVADRISQLLALVAGRLASRGAGRVSRAVVSPKNVERALPLVSSLVDLISGLKK